MVFVRRCFAKREQRDAGIFLLRVIERITSKISADQLRLEDQIIDAILIRLCDRIDFEYRAIQSHHLAPARFASR
jgi:hypothetical protein